MTVFFHHSFSPEHLKTDAPENLWIFSNQLNSVLRPLTIMPSDEAKIERFREMLAVVEDSV